MPTVSGELKKIHHPEINFDKRVIYIYISIAPVAFKDSLLRTSLTF